MEEINIINTLTAIEKEADDCVMLAKEHIERMADLAKGEAQKYQQEAIAKARTLKHSLENEFEQESLRIKESIKEKIAAERKVLAQKASLNKEKVIALLLKELLETEKNFSKN